MPDPGSRKWGDFLRKLKEENPEDYKMALLLGGAVTQALQREIQRSQVRDQLKGLFARLFLREGRDGKAPHKRKIALFLFTLVGSLFLIAFFFGTSPKKEATGGGVGVAAAAGVLSRETGASAGLDEGGAGKAEADETPLVNVNAGNAENADGKPGNASGNARGMSSSGAGSGTEAIGGAGSGATVPPPPPPVYGIAGAVPPPPDTSLSASGQSGQGFGPPPLILYQDTGLPGVASPGAAVITQTSPPASSASASTSSGSNTGTAGGMLFLALPSSGMLVVQGVPQGGMTMQGLNTPGESGGVFTPGEPPPGGAPFPQPPFPQPGGNR